MRIPVAVGLQSRDGTVTKDAKVVNGIIEVMGEEFKARTRPGLYDWGLLKSGTAQWLGYWNGVKAIIADYFIGVTSVASVPSATWSQRSTGLTTQSNCVGYGNGKYVAIQASSGKIHTSTDGITWTLAATITARNWDSIAWNGTTFCAIAYDATATAVSSDGTTWSEASGRLPATGHYDVVSNGTIFVCCRYGSRDTIRSTDGITWTATTNAMPTASNWKFLCWNGSVFCAAVESGSAAATSADGITWTARTMSETAARGCIVGGGGIIVAPPNSGTVATVSTDNGVTWADATMASGTWRAGASNGSAFVMVSLGSTASSLSFTGLTWQAATLVGNTDWCGVASNGTGFVAVTSSSVYVDETPSVTPVVNNTETALSPSSPGLAFSAQDNGSNAATDYLMFKNATQGWTVNGSGTIAAITDVDYPGAYSVTLTSLTRSGTVATATAPVDVNFQIGDSVTIAGAGEAAYNGSQTITGVVRSTAVEEKDIRITISRSGTTATATSIEEPHGLSNAQSVTISGAGQPEYNGTKTITWVSATQFTFTVSVTSNAVASPATGSPALAYPSSLTVYAEVVNVSGTTFDVTLFLEGVLASRTYIVGDSITITESYFGRITGTFTLTAVGAGTATFQTTITSTGAGYGDNPVVTVPAPPAVSSITSVVDGSSVVATVTTGSAHRLRSGDTYMQVSGCTQTQYNAQISQITVLSTTTFTYRIPGAGDQPLTPATGTISFKRVAGVTGSSFTYTVAGSPATPATGTITASIVKSTVPGIAYLNGYFTVMDVNGVVYNSAPDNPAQWNALEYTIAQNETGAGKCMAKSLNYLVAFKEWSTEFFYDAQNPIGSPFLPVDNGFTQVGCADGWSVALVDGNLMWLAQVRQRGRSVYVMSGIQQQKVSTPDVERILNADALTEVHAYGLKVDGHVLYLLTLVASNITLVYDVSSQVWSQWSSLTLSSSVSVSSITRSSTTATVTTATAHGLLDGEAVTISGANQSAYNGIFQIAYLTTTTFTIEVENSPTTPATGTILAYPYTESYFKFTKYALSAGKDYVLHTSDGHLYEILSSEYQDDGIPISFLVRTTRMDGGSDQIKVMSQIGIVGDTVDTTAMVRWSDDDMATSSAYRRVDLSLQEPRLRRCGSFKRRTLELKHVGDARLNLSGLELEIR